MTTLVLTDNPIGLALARELQARFPGVEIGQSPSGNLADVECYDLKTVSAEVYQRFELVISIQCRQLFPIDLIQRTRCLNVHAGFNPYNRGKCPQVFSILNGLKAGVTIHEIDEKIDHGAIIAQRECHLEVWDTSGSAYAKIMRLERELVLEMFPKIVARDYEAVSPSEEGNINYQKDFERLKHLDLSRQGTFGEFLNLLRALTHDGYRNAYFLDGQGRKVYVRIELEPEECSSTTGQVKA